MDELIIMVIFIIILSGWFFHIGTLSGYKKGQIDAITGNIKYESNKNMGIN